MIEIELSMQEHQISVVCTKRNIDTIVQNARRWFAKLERIKTLSYSETLDKPDQEEISLYDLVGEVLRLINGMKELDIYEHRLETEVRSFIENEVMSKKVEVKDMIDIHRLGYEERLKAILHFMDNEIPLAQHLKTDLQLPKLANLTETQIFKMAKKYPMKQEFIEYLAKKKHDGALQVKYDPTVLVEETFPFARAPQIVKDSFILITDSARLKNATTDAKSIWNFHTGIQFNKDLSDTIKGAGSITSLTDQPLLRLDHFTTNTDFLNNLISLTIANCNHPTLDGLVVTLSKDCANLEYFELTKTNIQHLPPPKASGFQTATFTVLKCLFIQEAPHLQSIRLDSGKLYLVIAKDCPNLEFINDTDHLKGVNPQKFIHSKVKSELKDYK
eukprot:gene18957-22691_t